jgi:hypothetical protein
MELTNQEIHQTLTSFKQGKTLKGIVVPLASINQLNKTLR